MISYGWGNLRHWVLITYSTMCGAIGMIAGGWFPSTASILQHSRVPEQRPYYEAAQGNRHTVHGKWQTA